MTQSNLLCAALLLLPLLIAAHPFKSNAQPDDVIPSEIRPPRDWCAAFNLSSSSKLAELSQIDIAALMKLGTLDLDEDLLSKLLDDARIGSVFNSPTAGFPGPVPTIDQWRHWNQRIYELSTTHGSKIPLIFGLDSVHGAIYVYNATIFPQQIGCAATFNTTVAQEMGRIGGKETRYAGVPWVFGPILGVAVQPSWPRVYETFGEDTFLASIMGAATVRGLQTPYDSRNQSGKPSVAACMKHFVGYPNSRTGHDRTPVWIPMNILLEYFVPPFQAAVDAGVLSAMENYIELNGRPVISSQLILQFLLRDVVQFSGMLVTDYNQIFDLKDQHHGAPTYENATWLVMNQTSVDMGMMPGIPPFAPFFVDLLEAVAPDLDPKRLNQSVNRVLDLKNAVGLFDGSPVPNETDQCAFACASHRQAGLDATRQSLTLLQNDGILPLPRYLAKNSTISVVGPACNSIGLMSGGWTIHWQGTDNDTSFGYGSTIFAELQHKYPLTKVVYSGGCPVLEDSQCPDSAIEEAVKNSQGADYVIVCLGERHYAEKPGDIFDLTLPGEQIRMVGEIAKVNKNIVAVLVEGRPRILGNVPSLARAILHSYLPGPSGGQAIVEVLRGVVNPSGRLPITYPKTLNNAPIQYSRKYSASLPLDYVVQWEFGYGLSYTSFTYLNMTARFDFDGNYYVQVAVKNTGSRAGSESVLVYSTQFYRRISPEVRRLRAVSKIHLEPGEEQIVQLQIAFLDLSYFDEFNCQVLELSEGLFFAGPLNISIPIQMIRAALGPFYRPSCSLWGKLAMENSGYSGVFPNPTPAPVVSHQATDYVSSIVCFGAGIVGTVIMVQWLRLRRKQSQEENPLLIDAENVSLRTE